MGVVPSCLGRVRVERGLRALRRTEEITTRSLKSYLCHTKAPAGSREHESNHERKLDGRDCGMGLGALGRAVEHCDGRRIHDGELGSGDEDEGECRDEVRRSTSMPWTM